MNNDIAPEAAPPSGALSAGASPDGPTGMAATGGGGLDGAAQGLPATGLPGLDTATDGSLSAAGDALGGLVAPVAPALHDFSALGLFLQADPVVKGVMGLLVVASIAVWAVILDKAVRLAIARREARAFERAVAANDLSTVMLKGGMATAVVRSAHEAWQDYQPGEARSVRRDGIERAMRLTVNAELRKLEVGLPLLASVGSAAPFVGLFGTVWGIMHSFTSIAQSNDTSLAVVAPGIAEALFATAIGLVAAIPAVLAFNALSVGLGRIGQRFQAAMIPLAGRLARDVPDQLRRAGE
ncbi:flagellar motor protein MotA [Rhodospirillum rubrum]|uniref:MotA/TolQ/ExbB proton channel family protein n=1 Tax=Rhodospirillum rubrum TaxID=1085 RepID=UPI0019056E53|nr:MotA/TolQ/ExbB proton channel family protein [Rhodospirillum rubrum]MBK1664142.1 flagellar motor protein MotA [Rhodospirillum rubrum]MBK1675617.1 flagellar motor protein MotA [Rhodospirillum rubrum]